MKRYKVATCTGYTIYPGASKGAKTLGLTASVLDTRHCHREVKRFRSEDALDTWLGYRLGHEGAMQRAQEYADKLNAECRRA